MPSFRARRAWCTAALLVASCRTAEHPGDAALDSARSAEPAASAVADTADPAAADSGRRVPVALPGRRRPRAPLSPLADSIAERLVFVPAGERWLVAAARGKRMLLDIGRVDVEVRRDPARLAAYKLAVADRSPIPAGTRLTLRGPWGQGPATVSGFDTWNGRVVAVLDAGPLVDSLAKAVDPLVGIADRAAVADTSVAASAAADTAVADSAVAAAACVRGDSLSAELRARVSAVRDSVEAAMRGATDLPTIERLVTSLRARASEARGCFGAPGRVAVAVTLWAGNYEWVRERLVLIDDAGKATAFRVADLRFKAHDLIGAFDADGDGVDDIAARGFGQRLGGTSVMRLANGRAERVAAGFSWETR